MNRTKTAAGYLRCSTDMQDDSVAQQRRAVAEWAAENNHVVVEWYEDEGKSGTSFKKRPAFNRMIRDVENRPAFDTILVYDESRWGRAGNPRESNYWKMHFELHGVEVRVINSQSQRGNDIGSYVVEVVESAEASEYSKKLSRSTLRGCKDNASRGFSNGGTAPYGYARVAVDKITGTPTRVLLPGDRRRKDEEKVVWQLGDDGEVATVRRIFEMKSEGHGYRAIANALNSDAVPCAKRGKWKNKNQMWSVVTIQSIITNPSYTGDRVYNRHPLSRKVVGEQNVLGKTKDHTISHEDEWIVLRDAHPAIVSRELFEKVNAPAGKGLQGFHNGHFYKSTYLLTGLVVCGRCGFNYQGQTFKRKDREYGYYTDGGYANKGASVCGRMSIRKEKLEGFIVDLVKEQLPFSASAKKFEEMFVRHLGNGDRYDEVEAMITAKLNEVEKKIQNLLVGVENGIGHDTAIPRIQELEKERARLSKERARIVAESRSSDPRTAAKIAAKFLQDFSKNFDNAPIQWKKDVLRQLVLGVTIDPNERTATCAISRIPLVSPALKAIVDPRGILSRRCSGART